MAKQLDPTLKQIRDDVEARVALLEYQFGQVNKTLGRIEDKQDAAIRQIDTLKYVSQHEFDQYKKDSDSRYADKESQKSITRLTWWVLGILAAIFSVGIAAFVGLVLKP